MCAYSYDLHLLRRLDSRRNLDALISPAQHYTGNYQYTLKSNESVRARFRLRSAKPRETEDWMRTSAVLPIPDEWFAPWVRPVYEPINKFREALRHRDVDPRWYWETDTPHVAEWDRSIGYDDRGSLRITNRAPSDVGEWKVALGREFFGEPFEPRTEYVLSAQVLVKGTPSARAVLGFAFGQAANAQWLAEANSRDRREWQTLSVTIPQQERVASRGYILLRLLDVGTVWFDNVRLKKGRVAPGRR